MGRAKINKGHGPVVPNRKRRHGSAAARLRTLYFEILAGCLRVL